MKKRDERMDLLIAESRALTETIAAAKSRLDKLHLELDPYFEGRGVVEHIATEFGTAMRILDLAVTIEPVSIGSVQAALGKRFPKYFATKTLCTAREDVRAELASSSGPLGQMASQYLVIDHNRHFVFSPGKVARVIDVL